MTQNSGSLQDVNILMVEDDPSVSLALGKVLRAAGAQLEVLSDPREALSRAENRKLDVALFDVNLPHLTGLELLKAFKSRQADLEVVVMTGFGSIDVAVQALKAGAYDFLTKPFADIEVLVRSIAKAAERRRLIARTLELEERLKSSADGIIWGSSAAMGNVARVLTQVAPTQATVLIWGESGTGKELVARAVHQGSPRAGKPFVALNCGALPETLLESELFGHVKGAFTGAAGAKKGLFEAANGGTLFLDEVGDMPLSTQVRLLRAIQESEVRPVGAVQSIKVDVRLIAATHVDLRKAVAQGRFREDLYYRLNVVNLTLPPLRERPEDVPLLAMSLVNKAARRLNKGGVTVSQEAMNVLVGYRWPGNIREMENVLECAVILVSDGVMRAEHLPPHMKKVRGAAEHAPVEIASYPYAQAKKMAVSAFDRQYVTALLNKTQGNIAAASVLAGLDRSNFRRLMRQYDIQRAAFAPEGAPDDGSESELASDAAEVVQSSAAAQGVSLETR